MKRTQNQATNANKGLVKLGIPEGPKNQNAVGVPVTGNINKPDYHDCEIIVVDRKNSTYAGMIKSRLKALNLHVGLWYPDDYVPLGRVLANIASRGCLYAIQVTNQHKEHNCITVDILQGQPVEHRNMPVEDAINLIADDFRRQLRKKAAKPVQTIYSDPIAAIQLKQIQPYAIQPLLNLVAVQQYDHVIKYLQDCRMEQLKLELSDNGNNIVTSSPDPEIKVQKKILSILNKPSVVEKQYDLLYPTLDAVNGDIRLLSLLKDTRVQNALDSLMDSSLVATIENQMKF